ncbi:hypothetical protein AURDEDRAFT_45599, partial [Auricularia subglabra TFB-10046 SS5]
LTVNSRDAIQNLATIAGKHRHEASTVARCVDPGYIRRVHPRHMLPALYVLDSICENIYESYGRLFVPLVEGLFLIAYASSGDLDRDRMRDLLATWRTGAASGAELFGRNAQFSLE